VHVNGVTAALDEYLRKLSTKPANAQPRCASRGRDVVQVKYEMLRRVRVDQVPMARAARAFGFSRPAFYQAQAVPRKRRAMPRPAPPVAPVPAERRRGTQSTPLPAACGATPAQTLSRACMVLRQRHERGDLVTTTATTA